MSQRIPPAIYQFFPFGTQEKILLEDATDGIYFDFQEATADDKLYIQLFDQGFQHPPSKLYRSDATITGDIIEVTCHFEVHHVSFSYSRCNMDRKNEWDRKRRPSH